MYNKVYVKKIETLISPLFGVRVFTSKYLPDGVDGIGFEPLKFSRELDGPLFGVPCFTVFERSNGDSEDG